jgi:hypothetical protein
MSLKPGLRWRESNMLLVRLLMGLSLACGFLVCEMRAAATCQVHVVLFVPADVKPPVGYQPRIDEMVDYTESFFASEFQRWGHEKAVAPFCRKPNGGVEVTEVRGKQPTAKYKPVDIRVEVMTALRQQQRITEDRQVWWILVYAGAPPARFAGYLGGFGPEIGGWAVCNFDTTPGRIDPRAPLGVDFLEKLTLKGMIHELGHGFQMPHIGPLQRDHAGNTLMGPTHANYRRVVRGQEDRVYLCEAEAALLANHPAFRGVADTSQPLPKVETTDLKAAVDSKRRAIFVSGRVKSSRPAVLALVGDEAEARTGEYWTKTYVGRVAADGRFEVIVSEPSESAGTLKTWFAFAGGEQTGDGQSRGRESGIAIGYKYHQSKWTFP